MHHQNVPPLGAMHEVEPMRTLAFPDISTAGDVASSTAAEHDDPAHRHVSTCKNQKSNSSLYPAL